MTRLNEIYKCEKCGNIVSILHRSAGKLICCGQEMIQQKENSVDAAIEKHVPVIQKKDNTYTVKVGSVAHPMLDEHYIEFVEIFTEARVYCAFLKPGENPEVSFDIKGDVKSARAYCNLHGLWKSN